MEYSGYPTSFLYVTLIVGLALIMVRPYWGFLFAVVLFGTINLNLAILTRTELLGPYFNLYDALFVVALFSIIRDSESSPLIAPRPVEWILLVIIAGTLQTLYYYHIEYLFLRALRWSITFPLAFFIGANALCNQDRAKPFLYAIIIGSVLNAIMSFMEYQGLAMLRPTDSAIRMAAAGNFLGVSLLVAASQQAFFPTYGLMVKVIWGAALVFLGLTVLFGQWRSVFLAVILAMISLPVILRRWGSFIRCVMVLLLGVPLLLITLHFSVPSVSAGHLLQRLTLVTKYLNLGRDIPKEDIPRWRQIGRDLEEWSKGNWLIGRGLGFTAFLPDGTDPNIAWGHVGYTSYLSQFGLLGLMVFAVYLPLQMLAAGKEVYFASRAGPGANLGLLTIVTVVLVSVICFMSSSYLAPTMHSAGFLYGATWSLAYGPAGPGKISPVSLSQPPPSV
jgi:hypothetical protein